ncbi:MAG TPA: ribosome biogenesis GTPase Der [Longimicrobiales bacterium]|nr:ribosome biogenesis GTPase Der [Longimicrobiales bacterium]
MSAPLPVVAIVGRPNVGKSTFFNRVIGGRSAIVEDRPGVTRDRNFGQAEWAGRPFWLVDTGGFIGEDVDPLAVAVRDQIMAAIGEADVVVFMVDGREGPTAEDQAVAEILRTSGRPVVLLVNKLDRHPEEDAQHEFWSLGLGEPLPVSSSSGRGSGDVLDAIVAHLPERVPPGDDAPLYIAVIGRPNVGKSSFANRLLGEERTVVSDIPGTTRDSIDTPFRYGGRDLVLVDTAGLRRQARVKEGVEYYSALRTERAIARSAVCLLLIDSTEEIHVQDLRIAERTLDAGCGLVIVANKWDLIEKDDRTSAAYEKHVKERAPSLAHVPMVFISALTGQRVRKALDIALEVADRRETRIATSEVNDVVGELVRRLPPPHHHGRAVKILYATQAGVRPPTFVFFSNEPKGFTRNYLRYLTNGLRRAWDFGGVPLQLRIRGRREDAA